MIAGLLMALAVAAGSPDPGAAGATLRALNEVRATHRLAPLHRNARLARAARRHSRDMVAHGYFGHVEPSGASLRSRVKRTGWMRRRPEWGLAENLAWGSGELAPPDAVVAAWMASPGHRRHILAPQLRVAGIGVVVGTPFGWPGATYTVDFGTARNG